MSRYNKVIKVNNSPNFDKKIKDVERSKSLEQLTEIDLSLQGIADSWADEDGQQTVRVVREELVILQQQKLATLNDLAQQSEAVETTLKSLLDATRTRRRY